MLYFSDKLSGYLDVRQSLLCPFLLDDNEESFPAFPAYETIMNRTGDESLIYISNLILPSEIDTFDSFDLPDLTCGQGSV